jgi:hypothetical protein
MPAPPSPKFTGPPAPPAGIWGMTKQPVTSEIMAATGGSRSRGSHDQPVTSSTLQIPTTPPMTPATAQLFSYIWPTGLGRTSICHRNLQ